MKYLLHGPDGGSHRKTGTGSQTLSLFYQKDYFMPFS